MKYKISDIASTGSGSTPNSQRQEYYLGGNIPWINSGELAEPFIYRTDNFITQLGYDSCSVKIFPIDTVLVAMYGATAGKTSLLKIPATTNQAICAIIPDKTKVDPYYLKYKLDTMYDYLVNLSTGSARNNLSQIGIRQLEVDLPDLPTQKRIASVLSNIDRKIALNRAMNEELEQTARDLYDYWFLQFDFPAPVGSVTADGQPLPTGAPYRSSGGKMVYNDTLKREIPQEWEVKSVNDLCVSQRGVSFDKSNELSKGGILVLRGNNIENNHLVYDNNIVLIPNELISDAQRIRKYDIIMTMSSGSKEHIGKSMMFQSDSPHTYGAFLNKFMPQANCEHFIFDFFKSSYFKAKIKSICNGTGINNLTMKDFDDVLLPMPDYKTLIAYSNIAKAIYEQYGCNEESTNSLRSLRDELLPLLMNGQVKVKE